MSNFQQTVTLLGVVGKKGAGTLDNGQAWATDRVELHCLTAFPSDDSMAVGNTVSVYNVDDYAKNFEFAKSLVGQNIILHMEMIAAKKLGQAPRIVCRNFQPLQTSKG